MLDLFTYVYFLIKAVDGPLFDKASEWSTDFFPRRYSIATELCRHSLGHINEDEVSQDLFNFLVTCFLTLQQHC